MHALGPGWICADDLEEWPCAAARDRINEQGNAVGVMSLLLPRACDELSDLAPGEVYARVVGWATR